MPVATLGMRNSTVLTRDSKVRVRNRCGGPSLRPCARRFGADLELTSASSAPGRGPGSTAPYGVAAAPIVGVGIGLGMGARVERVT